MTALEQVGLHDALAYLPLRAAPEQDAMGHHDAHHSLRVGDRQHVQQEGQIPLSLRRDSAMAVEAVVRVVGCEFVPPILQAEGRIGDHPVVGEEASCPVH